MANREIFSAGLGVGLFPANSGVLTPTLNGTYGSLLWVPGMLTTQAAWSSGSAYTAATDVAIGSMVSIAASTASYMCVVAGGGNSTVSPATGTGNTTTPGKTTTVMSDGYQWLCIGNSTADMTTLANGSQAVSQIILDSRPSQSEGDTMMEISISLATGGSGAAGDYVTVMLQWLNQDGTTYADGLAGGSSPSAPQTSQGNIYYSAGKSSPIVGSVIVPMRGGRCRIALVNQSGATLSSSTHQVSFRTGVFSLNG